MFSIVPRVPMIFPWSMACRTSCAAFSPERPHPPETSKAAARTGIIVRTGAIAALRPIRGDRLATLWLIREPPWWTAARSARAAEDCNGSGRPGRRQDVPERCDKICARRRSLETSPAQDDPYAAERARMVREQIERRGVSDPRVLRAMESVPRHLFVPEAFRASAHDDGPLPIGEGQTISQPYIVAFMSEAIRPRPTDRVLEIGTGSGYQTAVLSRLVQHVDTIEVRPRLADMARQRLRELGFANVTVQVGDGHRGLPEQAPFDAIIVTAAPQEVPPALLQQLAVGGRLVIPLGTLDQELVRVTRREDGTDREFLLPVRFVPLTREARRPD